MLLVGSLMIAYGSRAPLDLWHLQWLLFGSVFAIAGLLGLLGVNIWKGDPLDSRWDQGEPAPPPELMRTDRMAEDPTRPGVRWLPLEFVVFPDRCVACGHPHVGFWKIPLQRGVDLIVGAFHQVNWIAAPVCAHCRRQRRMASVLEIATVLLPLVLIVSFAASGLFDLGPTDFLILLGVMFVLAALWRSWGSAVLDQMVFGISGVRLEKGGRSGWVRFRSRRQAEEVVALTRDEMQAAEGKPRMPRLPTYVGTN